MRNLILIILGMFFCISLFSQNKDNVSDLNGDEFYFSIRGHINWSYYKINKFKYEQTLFSYYQNSTKDIKRNPYNETINVDLPDSLHVDHFMIREGFQAIKIDSTKSNSFVINGFKTTLSDAYGPRVIISIPDTVSYNWNDLFVIAKNSTILDQVTINPKKVLKDEVQEKVRSLIVDYLNTNRKILNNQLHYRNLIPDSLNNEQFKIEIHSRLDLSIVKLEQDCVYVNGFTLDNENLPFFAIVFLNDNKIIFEPHIEVINSFKILKDNYFFCNRNSPGKGIVVYMVLKFEANELKSVFGDGSYSM